MDSPDRLSKKGCDRNYLYLRVYFVCRQGHCVGYYYFFDIRLLRQSRRCIAGQHSVGGNHVDFFRTGGDDSFGCGNHRATGADFVIEQNRQSTVHASNYVQTFDAVFVTDSAFLNYRKRGADPVGKIARLFCNANIGGNNHGVVKVSIQEILDLARHRGELVYRNLEKALHLPGVQVDHHHPVGTRRLKEVGNETTGDRHPGLVFLIGTGVTVIRDNCRDATGRRTLGGIDHDQHLHDVIVHGLDGRLQDKNVLLTNVFQNFDKGIIVAELEYLDLPDVLSEVVADVAHQLRVRVTSKNDRVSVRSQHQVPLKFSNSGCRFKQSATTVSRWY